jgi:hypothetical protein
VFRENSEKRFVKNPNGDLTLKLISNSKNSAKFEQTGKFDNRKIEISFCEHAEGINRGPILSIDEFIRVEKSGVSATVM